MAKARMTLLDLRVQSNVLSGALSGSRLQNVYDMNKRTYMFKLSTQNGEKIYLLVESGFRIHTTSWTRDKSAVPSGFTMKLRKHLRTKRLVSVKQLGFDRVLDLQFGTGPVASHILLEFFAGGNIILTDGDYKILSVLRVHRDAVNPVAVNETYSVDAVNQLELMSEADFQKVFMTAFTQHAQSGSQVEKPGASDEICVDDDETDSRSRKTQKNVVYIKDVLTASTGYGPALITHALSIAGIPQKSKLICDGVLSPLVAIESDSLSKLYAAFVSVDKLLHDPPTTGYIILRKIKSVEMARGGAAHGEKTSVNDGGNDSEPLIVYHEFTPVLLKQYEEKLYEKFDDFNVALDTYFTKLESQKIDEKRVAKEAEAFKKYNKVKQGLDSRVRGLQESQEDCDMKAQLIEYNLHDVDEVITILRSYLAVGTDWGELKRIVKAEQEAGTPVAHIIHKLSLEKNTATLLLSFNLDNASEEDITSPVHTVDIDLSIGAFANACKYYEMRKKYAAKAQKTVESTEHALKAAERKAKEVMRDANLKAEIQKLRKPMWFEKFYWFISSENYLIIAGRDAQQNELVVKRHMSRNDVYVHADLHGAASCVVKNRPGGGEIPPLTLNQAGTFAICLSSAWTNKVVTSAWWVYANQVSKTAPSGEYLTTGAFMVRGKKHMLPPSHLVLGFGVIFKLDDTSIGRHLNERRVRDAAEDEESVQSTVKTLTTDDDRDTVSSLLARSVYSDSIGAVEGECESITDRLEDIDERHVVSMPEREDEKGLEKRDGGDEGTDEEAHIWDGLDAKVANITVKGDPETNISENDVDTKPETQSDDCGDVCLRSSENKSRSSRPLTAKERRQLKKQRKLGLDTPNPAVGITEGIGSDQSCPHDLTCQPADSSQSTHFDRDQDSVNDDRGSGSRDETGDDASATASVVSSSRVGGSDTAAPQFVRGKRGKMKKKMLKYAEQDEDERMLAMSILQSAGKKKVKGRAAKKEAEAQQAAERRRERDRRMRERLVQEEKARHSARASQGPVLADAPQSARRQDEGKNGPLVVGERQDESPLVDDDREREEIAALLKDENIALAAVDEKLLSELDSFTAVPSSEDTLLYALPACGPYNSMTNFKYKVKLVPGNVKKGKAARTAIEYFLRKSDCLPTEKQLIKSIDQNDLFQCIVNKSKVVTPGSDQNKRR